MQKLYLFLFIASCVIIILVVSAFFYIDTHRHHTFYFNIEIADKATATVKLDKFVTEDKIIYRSIADTPFHSTCGVHKRKLVLDRRGLRTSDYNKKSLGDRVSMDIYLKRVDSSARFLAIGHSSFAYLDRLAVDKDFVLFEEDALISYACLAQRYDFKKQGVQKFQAITHNFALLPPMKQTISLRLAGEKPINLGNKKVDAFRLILKLPDYKEVSIWINKWTHALLKVENPRINFKATLTDDIKNLSAKEYVLEGPGYVKKDILFKNKDVSLSGTLAVPEIEGPHPAILLIWGPGPLDREGLGMFTNLAHYLASNGFAVLSFDKRGIGKSHGNFSRFTKTETRGDLQAALDFLAQQEEIDKEKIGILGHSEGGFYASQLTSSNQNVSACIIMAGMVVSNIYDTDLEAVDYFNRLSSDWDKEYLTDMRRSAEQTARIIQGGKDWTLFLGKRIYLKKARLDLENNPLDAIRKVKVPTLLVQGKKDTVVLPEHARLLERALKEGGNQNYRLAFFDKLGHFFGQIVQDGIHRTHLATDERVMETIVQWLKENLTPPQKEEIPTQPEEETQEPAEDRESPETDSI